MTYVNQIAEAAAWTDDDGAVIVVLRTGRNWSHCRLARADAAKLADQLQRLTASVEVSSAGTHVGTSWGPEHSCWHEWPCGTSTFPHHCTFGRGHRIDHHHCPCGADQPT